MAIVSLGTQTVDLDLRTRLDFGPFTHREGRAFMYFLQAQTPNIDVEGSYLNINTTHANGGDNVRLPLLAKFFPTTTKMAFLVKVPRIIDANNQQILIQLGPKEFYRGAATTRQYDVELFWEDSEELRLTDSFP